MHGKLIGLTKGLTTAQSGVFQQAHLLHKYIKRISSKKFKYKMGG